MSTAATLPELGPWLGRLCNAGAAGKVLHHFVPLDDIRLALATGVLDLAGAARGFSGDDHAAIVGSLHARSWRQLWEKALGGATRRTADAINAGFTSAAAESRFPKRRLARLQVNEAELAAMTARLGAGAIPFEASLSRLEELAHAAGASGPRSEAAFGRWSDGLAAAARQLESAWMALEEAVDREGARWQGEIEKVRQWTRPRWPLWVMTGVLLAAAAWLGLVLGGFLQVPAWLLPFAEFWWTRLPFA
ncbi:MAG: hypothetical protein H6Q77_798 [Gemmatimonadetes bacterium]|nr:hypothetical protein [Gemmatimonadota bacterium]